MVHLLLPSCTLAICIINRALWFVINLSFQMERLLMTTDNGMSEVIALSLVDNLRESVQQDLEDDLKDEIYD